MNIATCRRWNWRFHVKFDRPLPISAEGETEVHRAMGFDHRGRVDVAVVPTAPEGIWLRQYLQVAKDSLLRFFARDSRQGYRAHIHIGPGSTRLGDQLPVNASALARTAPISEWPWSRAFFSQPNKSKIACAKWVPRSPPTIRKGRFI